MVSFARDCKSGVRPVGLRSYPLSYRPTSVRHFARRSSTADRQNPQGFQIPARTDSRAWSRLHPLASQLAQALRRALHGKRARMADEPPAQQRRQLLSTTRGHAHKAPAQVGARPRHAKERSPGSGGPIHYRSGHWIERGSRALYHGGAVADARVAAGIHAREARLRRGLVAQQCDLAQDGIAQARPRRLQLDRRRSARRRI